MAVLWLLIFGKWFYSELVCLVFLFAFIFENLARTLVAGDFRSPSPLLLSQLA